MAPGHAKIFASQDLLLGTHLNPFLLPFENHRVEIDEGVLDFYLVRIVQGFCCLILFVRVGLTLKNLLDGLLKKLFWVIEEIGLLHFQRGFGSVEFEPFVIEARLNVDSLIGAIS